MVSARSYTKEKIDELLDGVIVGEVGDGDRGDVVISDGGSTWTVPDLATLTDEVENIPELVAATPSEVVLSTSAGVTTLTLSSEIARQAGLTLYAAIQTAYLPIHAYKASNEIIVNNPTTPTNIASLTVPVVATGIYQVTALFRYSASTTADALLDWSGPAGATFDWGVVAPNSGTASPSSTSINRQYRGIGEAAPMGGTGDDAAQDLVAQVTGRLAVSSTAGTFRPRLSQQTLDVSDVTCYAGSWMTLQRLG